jgi:hypothetical protein
MNAFSYLFLIALAASLGVRLWLAARQIAHVKQHRDTVPDSFVGRVPMEDHHKAADYTLTNTRIGIIALFYDSLLLLGWTFGGGLEWLDNSWRALELQPVVTGTVLILSAFVIMTLLDLPFSLYHTFVVEVSDTCLGLEVGVVHGLAVVLALDDGVGPLEGPRHPAMGACEGASLMTEKRALDQVLRQGGAVEHHHGLVFAGSRPVDQPRQQLLSRAAFAQNERAGF